MTKSRKDSALKPAKGQIESVFLQITSSCNLRCRYCYAHSREPAKSLSSGSVEGILRTLANYGRTAIIFSGGEPCLDPRLSEFLRLAAYDYGHRPAVVTNGVHLPEELFKTILSTGTQVQLSLDTLNHKRYKYLCGTDTLNDVLRNIAKLQRSGIELSISLTATEKNVNDVLPIVEYCLKEGITLLHVGKLVKTGRASCYRDLGDVNLRTLWDILYPMQLQYYKHIGIDLVEEFVLPFATGVKRLTFCAGMAGRGLEITSSGRICACGMMPKEEFTYGYIDQCDFGEIISGLVSGAIRLFDCCKLSHCHNCEARWICGGGCRAIAYITSGDPYGTYPDCDSIVRILTELQNDIDTGKLDDYINFLRCLPSERAESSRYF